MPEKVRFNRNITKIKEIDIRAEDLRYFCAQAWERYPDEYAAIMYGKVYENSISVEGVAECSIVSDKHSFRLNPEDSKRVKGIIKQNNYDFVGVLHTHPTPPKIKGFEILSLILSGRDSFFMYRLCEHVRGIIAMSENRAYAIFWAFGRHVPLKITGRTEGNYTNYTFMMDKKECIDAKAKT